MSVHLVDSEGRPLCPIADELDALDDGAFWERVAMSLGVGCPPDTEPDYDDDLPTNDLTPCPECGELGACAYDAEGRALIHVINEADEEQP